MIGRTLSHYQIVDEISRGGMGVVYRAIDVRLNREVALKVLPPELVGDADRRRRFVQEAQAASALEHPHIAVIHEIDEADGVTFIAMELVRGEKLADLAKRRRLSPARALELAIEIAEGLARAHDKNIVHRDLKPANVMLTEDGHAKIIDFGLAKLLETGPAHASAVTQENAETGPGVVLGTTSYMSPEQAAGDRVDHRTDIFSFGVLLYELLAGERPFQGRTSVDTLHAILNAPMPPLPDLGTMPETGHTIERLVEKCLAKDPAERYQGMRDLVVDLRAARRSLETSDVSAVSQATGRRASAPAPVAPRRPRRGIAIGAGAVVVAAIAIGVLLLKKDAEPTPQGSKPSVAVLYFENNTGNASLDWLRTGLTDMVVTDLSQVPDIQVLGTDRLHRILNEMKRADDRVISADVVEAVARQAGVETVLLGSYVKAGETFRINLKLQEAATGRIVTSERVEGPGDANIFSMVDDLTRRIRAKLLPRGAAAAPAGGLLTRAGAPPPAAELDRGLTDVTTASIEAYRHYSEGIDLHQRLKEAEALPHFQKAIAVDPSFAMALAKLAIVYNNLQMTRESADAARRALDLSDRLTTRERLYIEAVHYSRRPETLERAIATYRKLIELYPDDSAARHNLGLYATQLGREDEAIEHFEELRRLGGDFPSTYGMLAAAYGRKGDFARGEQVLKEYLARFPASGAAVANLAGLYLSQGRYDEAAQMAAKSAALGTRAVNVLPTQWMIAILREQWGEAENISRRLSAENDLFARMVGALIGSTTLLYQGRTKEAMDWLERGVRVLRPPLTTEVRAPLALLRLERGDTAGAVADLQKARAEAQARFGLDALPLLAEALERSGKRAAADERMTELRTAVEQTSDPALRQLAQLMDGRLALLRGDHRRAIDGLTALDKALLPRVMEPPTIHAFVWDSLAHAHLVAGDRDTASKWFRRIIESRTERVNAPLESIRAHYFLAKIAEESGDAAGARQHYQRFLDYWKDGDIDRERVAEAVKKTSADRRP